MSIFDQKIKQLEESQLLINEIIRQVIVENAAIIADMNSQIQLYEQGVNADGIFIADYAPYQPQTISIKQGKGQPTNRVTLRDTGDFHASFEVLAENDSFSIYVDSSQSKLAEKLIIGYGERIFGLTEENLDDLKQNYIKPVVLAKLKEIYDTHR